MTRWPFARGQARLSFRRLEITRPLMRLLTSQPFRLRSRIGPLYTISSGMGTGNHSTLCLRLLEHALLLATCCRSTFVCRND